MAIAVTHSFVATGSETAGAAAAGKVVTSEWNAAHVLGGFGTGVATALAINVGSAGAPVLFNGALGTPSSCTLSSCTGLPVGSVTGLGTGVATWLATPSYANLSSAVTGATLAILGANSFVAEQTVALGTITTDIKNWTGTATWNASGVTFAGIKLNVTNTASAAASTLLDLQVGSVSKFSVNVAGGVSLPVGVATIGTAGTLGWPTHGHFFYNAGQGIVEGYGGVAYVCLNEVGVILKSDAWIGFSPSTPSTNNPDCIWSRGGAAATIQQGKANAASPVAQILQAQGSRSGTDTDVAGAAYTIRPGAGTGAAVPGALILQSYVAVASGTGTQTATATITLNSGNATLGGMLITKGYAIGSLPAGVTGAVVHVTDQITAPAAKGIAPTAGGAIKCLVMYDGAGWVGV